MKKIRYALEATLLYLLFGLFGLLPAEKASAVGGWIGRTIGPRLAASRKAIRNLSFALPDLSEEEEDEIVAGMWDNLGRVIAEYPHLEEISKNRTVAKNTQTLEELIKENKPAVLAAAHLANWEVNAAVILTQMGRAIDLTYRAPNNPLVETLLYKSRTMGRQLKAFPKSSESGRHILQTLRNRGFLGILIDQKYNEGVNVPFFNRPAMTNPIFVQLSQKYKCDLILVRAKRLPGCRFEVSFLPPLKLFDDQDKPLPVEDVIAQAHAHLEDWIRETPEQWLWLHRRWIN